MTNENQNEKTKDWKVTQPSPWFDDNSQFSAVFGKERILLHATDSREPSEWIRKMLNGRTLIDVGSGGYSLFLPDEKYGDPMPVFSFKAGCKKYIAVDPIFEKDKVIHAHNTTFERKKTDGLSYLLTQPNSSAIIVANGLFCEPFAEAYKSKDPHWLKYVKNLKAEMYRVSCSIIFGNYIWPEASEMLEEAGFKDILPKSINPEKFIFQDRQTHLCSGMYLMCKESQKEYLERDLKGGKD